METDAVKNTTDTVNPDCCTDIDVTDTANNKSPVSLKKDSASEVSQEDASSQTTNSELWHKMGLSHQGIYLHVTIPFSLSSHGYRNFSKGQYCLLSIFFPYFQPSVPTYLQCKCLSGRVSVCNCDLMSRDHVMCHIIRREFQICCFFSQLVHDHCSQFITVGLFRIFFCLIKGSCYTS